MAMLKSLRDTKEFDGVRKSIRQKPGNDNKTWGQQIMAYVDSGGQSNLGNAWHMAIDVESMANKPIQGLGKSIMILPGLSRDADKMASVKLTELIH